MICTPSTCLECGQPFDKCICREHFRAVVDPETAMAKIAAFTEASEHEEEQGDLANLLLHINELAQQHEFISLLSLCYDVGSSNGRGFPYVDQLEWALDTLVELGQIQKVDDTGDHYKDHYRAVAGAPILAMA